jgi:putative hydrolase of the HAD superfamily
MLPEAVIFDMDGLLVDTETCDYEAWRELHEAHGVELTLPEYCYSAGLYGSWEAMYEALGARCGRTPDELHAIRDPRFRELVEERLRPSAELLGLLERLRGHGAKRGIASSSDSDWVEYLVEGLGLRAEFQAIATGHDVQRRKPAPDVYLLAAERLGVDPARCVALEDSSHGIEAARAAGMRAIAIPNSVSMHQDLSQANARVEHFGEVTLELLQRLIAHG